MTSWLRVAPPYLDPVLALVERIDRSLRGVRPIRPDGLLGVERRRHRGEPVTLEDGTAVGRGDEAWIIHFDNRRVHELASEGWQTAGYRAARADLAALAAWHAKQGEGHRPVAYTGITLLTPLTVRLGFEVRARDPSAWAGLEDWYLRSLLARWAREGRERLDAGRHPLRAGRAWMSGDELVRRYAPREASGHQ